MTISSYKVDKVAAEETGVEVPFGEDESVTVRRFNCKKAGALTKKLYKPYSTFKELPDGVGDKILAQVLAEAVIVDWKLKGEDGEYIPFSVDTARELLVEMPDLANDIFSVANSREPFHPDNVEAVRKNSKK